MLAHSRQAEAIIALELIVNKKLLIYMEWASLNFEIKFKNETSGD